MTASDSQLSQRQIVRAIALAGLLLLVVFGAILLTIHRTNRLRYEIRRVIELERSLSEIFEATQDAETGQRGYLLTQNQNYLLPFNSARQRAEESLRNANRYVDHRPEEMRSLDTLRQLLDTKFTELSFTITLVERGDIAQALAIVNNNEGQWLMEEIRRIIRQTKQKTGNEVSAIRTKTDRLQAAGTWLSIFSLLALVGILVFLYRRLTPLVTSLIESLYERDVEITHRRKIEKQRVRLIEDLQMKNEELDHFAYIASHDLQEPLRTVNNFVELIEEEYGELIGAEGVVYFDFLNSATNRMRLLIKNLRTYSQIGRKGTSVPVDLNNSVLKAIQNLSAIIDERRARINVAPLPLVQGYPIELIQIFQNLISNAIKFVPADREPEVKIYGSTKDNLVTISVSDNGIGIEEDEQTKIFQMFSRIHPTGSFEGQGIGLTFCRRIAELHGGQLALASRPGEGSIFSFTIRNRIQNETKTPANTSD